jgi:hypothetical protein
VDKHDARVEKFGTETGESYRYPDARVTASAVWRLCIFWYEVHSGLAGITLHVIPSWVLLYP